MTGIRAVAVVLLLGQLASAQVGGNIGYGQQGGRSRAEQNEHAKRVLTREEMPPTDTAMFVDASVLMNVKADQFVATFGIAEEAPSIEECQQRMNATVAAFTEAVRPLGIGPEALFVDFTAETKVYDYKLDGNVASERLAGFEVKKTIAVRYREQALIDRLIIAASKARVHDLIKVDYVVTDLGPIQDRVGEEAVAVIKSKADRYQRLLGIKTRSAPRVYAERMSAYYPSEMYSSYVASESGNVNAGFDRSRMTVHDVRKSRTFFFHPLDGNGFDRVINPVVLEPVVQFTLYLKLKYETDGKP